MVKQKHQYRAVLTIQDDFHREKDLLWKVSFPSHPSLKKAVREFEQMKRILSKTISYPVE